jgi:hypothetical protein
MQVMMGHEEGFLPGDIVLNLSLPDLIRQSIFFENAFLRRRMDTRVKPAYDEFTCP